MKSNKPLKGLWIAEVGGRMRFRTTVSADKLWAFENLVDLRAGVFIFQLASRHLAIIFGARIFILCHMLSPSSFRRHFLIILSF